MIRDYKNENKSWIKCNKIFTCCSTAIQFPATAFHLLTISGRLSVLFYLEFSIRWEAILQHDALTTEPFQSQQTRLLSATNLRTFLFYFSKTMK